MPDDAKKWQAEKEKYSAPFEKAPMPREVSENGRAPATSSDKLALPIQR
jgi:hypothetical protein